MAEGGARRRSAPRSWRSSALLYVALALGLSWVVWVPALWLDPDPVLPFIVVGAFGPAVAGVVMVRRSGGSVRAWLKDMLVVRLPLRWYAFALAVPVLIAAAQTLAVVAVGTPLAPELLPGRVATFLVGVVLVFLLGGGQEEPGWRGYLLPNLQDRSSPLAASVLVGVVWAVWHLPLFAFGFDQYAGGNPATYLLTLVAFAVVLTVVWNRTGASLILVMLLHAAFNSASTLVPIRQADVEALEEGLAGEVAMVAVVVALALVLIARHGRRLGGPARAPAGVLAEPAGRRR